MKNVYPVRANYVYVIGISRSLSNLAGIDIDKVGSIKSGVDV